MSGGDFVNGKRTAELAGVVPMTLTKSQLMENIYQSVIGETAREMALLILQIRYWSLPKI